MMTLEMARNASMSDFVGRVLEEKKEVCEVFKKDFFCKRLTLRYNFHMYRRNRRPSSRRYFRRRFQNRLDFREEF